jgi:dienelactone hydrolase
MERVTFTTYDDVKLVANLYIPAGSVGWWPGIVVCPGFGSSKERHAGFGERAAAAGFAALIIDPRGHGESNGEMDANLFNDVAAACHYLQSRPEVNPMSVGIRGSSLGGWLAIHTAAHLKDVAPVIAYCPTNEGQLTILMEEVAMVQRGHPSPMIQGTPPRVNVNSTLQLLYRLDMAKAARRIHPRHLLLIQCEGDEVVPSHISQRIYDEAQEPKTFWLLPGGDHNFAQHDPDTDARVLEWLRTARPDSQRLTPEDIPAESEA